MKDFLLLKKLPESWSGDVCTVKDKHGLFQILTSSINGAINSQLILILLHSVNHDQPETPDRHVYFINVRVLQDTRAFRGRQLKVVKMPCKLSSDYLFDVTHTHTHNLLMFCLRTIPPRRQMRRKSVCRRVHGLRWSVEILAHSRRHLRTKHCNFIHQKKKKEENIIRKWKNTHEKN